PASPLTPSRRSEATARQAALSPLRGEGERGEASRRCTTRAGFRCRSKPATTGGGSPSPLPPSLGASARPRRNEVEAGNGERAGVRGENGLLRSTHAVHLREKLVVLRFQPVVSPTASRQTAACFD